MFNADYLLAVGTIISLVKKVMKVKTYYEFEPDDLELLKKELPYNPCKKCSWQHRGCCGCLDRKKYSQAVQPYRDRGIYELALKLKRQKEIQREIIALKNESKNITDEIIGEYPELAAELNQS